MDFWWLTFTVDHPVGLYISMRAIWCVLVSAWFISAQVIDITAYTVLNYSMLSVTVVAMP